MAIFFPLAIAVVGLIAFNGFNSGLAALIIASVTFLKTIWERNISLSNASNEIALPAGPWRRTGVTKNASQSLVYSVNRRKYKV